MATLEQMLEHDTASLNLLKNGKIIQFLKQCYGHPRCVHLSECRCHRLLSLHLAYGCHSLTFSLLFHFSSSVFEVAVEMIQRLSNNPMETQMYTELQSAFRGLCVPSLDFQGLKGRGQNGHVAYIATCTARVG